MHKKVLSVPVITLLVGLLCIGSVPARAQTEKDARAAQEVKAKIVKLGVGQKAVVRVTLRDNREIKGWISSAAENDFTVTDSKSGQPTVIAYRDVAHVKNLRPSKAAIAGLIAAFSVGAVLLLALLGRHIAQ